jgi:hypothetical protein
MKTQNTTLYIMLGATIAAIYTFIFVFASSDDSPIQCSIVMTLIVGAIAFFAKVVFPVFKARRQNIVKSMLKWAWLLYITILLSWIFISFTLSHWTFLYESIARFTIIFLILSFMFIVYNIVIKNKDDVSHMFIDLSKLPLLILASHVVVLLSGKTFNPAGGWWILYILLVLCPIISLIFFTTGLIIRSVKKNK